MTSGKPEAYMCTSHGYTIKNNTHVISHLTPSPPYQKQHTSYLTSPLHHPTKNNTHVISLFTPSPPYQKQHTHHISPHPFTTLPKTTHTSYLTSPFTTMPKTNENWYGIVEISWALMWNTRINLWPPANQRLTCVRHMDIIGHVDSENIFLYIGQAETEIACCCQVFKKNECFCRGIFMHQSCKVSRFKLRSVFWGSRLTFQTITEDGRQKTRMADRIIINRCIYNKVVRTITMTYVTIIL